MTPFYDPLDHVSNAVEALLRQEPQGIEPLWDKRPGVYLYSYVGDLEMYQDIRGTDHYIYVGCSETDFGLRTRNHFRTLTEVWDLGLLETLHCTRMKIYANFER